MRPCDVDSYVDDFTNRIVEAARYNIKQTTGRGIWMRQKRTVWWNERCSRAVAERRRARRRLEKHPSEYNLLVYRAKTLEAKKVCENCKRVSFQNYIEGVKYDTPKREVWRKIRSIKNISFSNVMPIEDNGVLITDPIQKANQYALHLQNIATPGKHAILCNFNKEYEQACDRGQDQSYNGDITMEELVFAINTAKNKASGLDDVTAVLLKNLPMNMISQLLNIMNESYMTGYIPDAWKVGLVVPILKSGKSTKEIESYRPISLLSCIGKLMERVIQRRLEYVVAEYGILQNSQLGFRKGESTMDVLLRIEHIVRKCMSEGKVCIIVYIDLKSAFDSVWSDGLIWKLINSGITGKMLRWLCEYFKNRKIQVRVQGHCSDKVEIKAGTPQGAVLSPLLFNIMMADMPDSKFVEKHIYADDITVTCCGKTTREVKKNLQQYLKDLFEWTETWGFQWNIGKTFMQHFTRRRMQCPIIRVQNQVVKYKKKHTILGLIFDSPLLTWKAHTEYLRNECLKRVQIMRSISSYSWGMSSRVLKQFYIAYIRAKLDYGSVLYASASNTMLKKLDVIQNACCRMVLGAKNSSPTLSVQVEANIPPLALHRSYLSLKALIRLRYKPEQSSTVHIMNLNKSKLCVVDFPVNSFVRRAINGGSIMNMCSINRIPTRHATTLPPWQELEFVQKEFDEQNVAIYVVIYFLGIT